MNFTPPVRSSARPSRYLVGPVFSRRLGRSLGVDLLQGECTFLCPYCEVRVHHVEKLRLIEFKNTAALFSEYRQFCESHSPADLDSVTFSGTGEPTLISNLGKILREFRRIGPFPLTVITNGSLLWMPQVRRNLAAAGLVVPSLDAVTESAWRRVNRPHPDMTLKKYLDGTRRFCARHPGKIWMEVLLARGVNDGPEDIDALGRFLKRLRLDKVQIGTVDRPPARSRVRPIPPARLARIARQIAALSGRHVELMARPANFPGLKSEISVLDGSASGGPNPKSQIPERVLQSVRLRPQTPAELRRLLSVPKSVFDQTTAALERAGRIARARFGRRTFFKFNF